MTKKAKIELRRRFFREAGPNVETVAQMANALRDECFYLKDRNFRIIAINRRNCEVCNIRDEMDAVGLRSDELFPKPEAESYLALDREVIKTGQPVLNRITERPADKSTSVLVSNVYPVRNRRGKIIGTMRIYRLATDDEVELSRRSVLRKVAEFVNEKYMTPLTVAQLAALAKQSETNFKRAFSAEFGLPPGKYVVNARINAARKLLETTDNLISDIATAVGFYDQSHFSKAFLAFRGMTPGEYRRRHRQGA